MAMAGSRKRAVLRRNLSLYAYVRPYRVPEPHTSRLVYGVLYRPLKRNTLEWSHPPQSFEELPFVPWSHYQNMQELEVALQFSIFVANGDTKQGRRRVNRGPGKKRPRVY